VEQNGAVRQRPAWLLVAVLCAIGIIGSFQFTLLVPLVTVLPPILGESVGDVQWLVTVTLLMGAVSTPLFARMADMFGRRRLLLLSLAFIAVGSLMAALSSSLWMLILARLVNGLSGGITPIGIALMRDQLPRHRLAFGISLMTTTIGVGSAIGLPVSGWLNEAFGWQAGFWLSLVTSLVLMALVPLTISSAGVRTGGRFDWLGAILLSVALTAMLLVISKGGSWGWASPPVIGLAVVAAAAFLLWLQAERRAADPLVALGTTFSRPILLTNASTFLTSLAMFGNMFITTAQLQVPVEAGGFGLSTLEAASLMVPSSVALMAFSPVGGWLAGRLGARPLLMAGAVLTIAAYAWRLLALDSVPQIVLSTVVLSIGTAFSFAATPLAIIAFAPAEETAQANGVNQVVRSIGASVCSAIIAAAFGIVAHTAAGAAYPTTTAFLVIFWMAIGAATVGAVVTAFIPRMPAPAEAPAEAVSP